MRYFFKIIKRLVLGLVGLVGLVLLVGWVWSLRHSNVDYGVSFSVERSTELGLLWQTTYTKILTDLQPKFVRLSVPWTQVEPVRGQFNWEVTDWLLAESAKYGTKVTLVVGQKTPRWPECRFPDWAAKLSREERRVVLFNYVRGVVERYRTEPALELWQVENEPFINFEFGECDLFDREAVAAEVAVVRSLDTKHPILITDSGELGSWREAIATGDVFGTTLYRVVNWPNGWPMYYDWLPPKLFAMAAWLRNISAAEMYIAELQAEPWFTNDNPLTAPVEEQKRAFSVERLRRHAWVAEHVGSPRAYWWGVEWWYFMKEKQNEPAYWDAARALMSKE